MRCSYDTKKFYSMQVKLSLSDLGSYSSNNQPFTLRLQTLPIISVTRQALSLERRLFVLTKEPELPI